VNDLVFVADVHLVEGDAEAPIFEDFLRSLPGRARTCVIVGDLFNVWIARRRFTSPGQARLLEVMRQVRAQGVEFKYVEGNRDYFVGETWAGDPFAVVATASLVEPAGPVSLLVSHGDLVNEDDRQYRMWRAASRSWPMRLMLALLPGGVGRSLANRLEKRLRGTNLRHKGYLPDARLEAYTRRAIAAGHAGVVLGHFHREIERAVDGGTLWVLPDWKDGRRYLSFSADGRGRFVPFAPRPERAADAPGITPRRSA
jgi:UDP-2,3-diacylglucosamine hydrolase